MDIKSAVKETEYFLLDMDGTIYIDGEPIGDMVNTLKRIRESGRKIMYLTNNSSKSATTYVERLSKTGLYQDGDYVYTSGMACAEYLNSYHKGQKVYLVGTDSLIKEFKKDGINLTDDNPDVAVLAFDTTINYEKIEKFNKFIVKGAKYIATHPDTVCPASDVSIPDVGSFIKMFECSANRLPDVIIGKPYTAMGETVMRKFNLDKSKFMMVGDRLHTDIAFGVNCGFHSLLVMSGETTESILNASPITPENVLGSLNDIVPYLF